ncbi:DUF4399 domain-containing protein [Permianibacter sp. IMCC34836]|uniref:DUF4399 domain-containing protein n=1 Tax=Permianibacter fluminis TaxID=2738515 RepID=UPI0015575083|nr:DUF4399 domain-containing protein [Permianibacter fluminis]NQD36165.1 DUF4399 domain-containing protein [Permianibacter fluminis]
MQALRTVLLAGLAATFALSGHAADLPRTTAPANATLYFISPQDGEHIKGPVTVRFGLSGMGVAPAGLDKENTGHHHLLIDMATLPALDQPLPATDQIKHFGGGQTETVLTLSPGKHTLQLLLGDKSHIPHQPTVLSKAITITVE